MYNRHPLTKGCSRDTRPSKIKLISSLDSRDQQSNVHQTSKGGERMQHFPNFSGRKLLSGAPEQQGPRWGGGEEARAWRLCRGAAGEGEEGTGQQARLQRRRASRERDWGWGQGRGEDEQCFLISFIITVVNTTMRLKKIFFVENVFTEMSHSCPHPHPPGWMRCI